MPEDPAVFIHDYSMVLTKKGTESTFYDDVNVLYLGLSDGYLGVYISQGSGDGEKERDGNR